MKKKQAATPRDAWSSKAIGLVMIVGIVVAAGCDAKAARLPVTGAVTLDGQPLIKGQINFSPQQGSAGPTAGSPVIDGRYAILAERGPMAGKLRVEITALRPTTQKKQAVNLATGQMETTSEQESMIPPRYNLDSELTAEVTADGPNEFNFNLKTE